MKSVLITGANGFLGYYLVEQLLANNFTVIATGGGECRLPFKEENFIYRSMDFVSNEEVKDIFNEFQPHVVVHTGAISKPDECEANKANAFRINVTGSINLLNESSRIKSHFIFLSTDFIFDGRKGLYKEDDVPAPVNYYGETKLLAEEEVKKYDFKWAIVRTVLVYGKTFSGRDNIVTLAAKALQKGETLKIFADQVRTPTYVEDLAGSIVTIIEKETTGIFHISGEEVKTPYDMVVAVANYLGLKTSLVEKATAEDFQPHKNAAKRPLKTGFDISKAKRELNFQPLSFEEGLKKSLEI